LPAWDLDAAGPPQLSLDVSDDRAQTLRRDVALLGRLLEPGEELLGVEVLAAPVLLGDVEGHRLDALVRGEALPALQAFTPPADRLPDLGVSGVDHLQVVVTAIRATHGTPVFLHSVAEKRGDVDGAEALGAELRPLEGRAAADLLLGLLLGLAAEPGRDDRDLDLAL